MEYTIPVDVCPVPCKNPIVVFLEYVKTNTVYANSTFNSTNATDIITLTSAVTALLVDGFIIDDNNCDNVCCPTCSLSCIPYLLSSNTTTFTSFITANAPVKPTAGTVGTVLPCCLNILSAPGSYPYSLLNCNRNTFSCCNAFNYKIIDQLAKFVKKYDNPTNDVYNDIGTTTQFLFEFGTFNHESALNTLLTELATFTGYVPYALLTAMLNAGIVANCKNGKSYVVAYASAATVCASI